jgi:stage II sporulation protein AA (anti-sigma F factor antagonist)
MDIVVIEFHGGIDDFPSLVQTIDLRIEDGDRNLVVDLAPLPFINSAALGYLIKARKNVEDEGGELALARVQPAITRILEMAHLDEVLPSFQTVEEAIVYLGGDPDLPDEGPRVRRETWKP